VVFGDARLRQRHAPGLVFVPLRLLHLRLVVVSTKQVLQRRNHGSRNCPSNFGPSSGKCLGVVRSR
jgi:hypothetical protein